jgi:3-hydroxybutyryl-CoA dehydrogenase
MNGVSPMSISVVGVVGAGFMGSGIGESVAAAGKQVLLYEPEPAPLQRSRQSLEASVGKAVSRGKLSPDQATGLVNRVRYTTTFTDLKRADAVIEAVTENPDVKRELFARLDDQLPDARFLASNTSSIPLAELASWTARPDRVLGLHFFSPVPIMKLVEVVVALDTTEATVTVAEQFALEISKQPIRTKDRAGFIVNMLLASYLVAAVRMYEEGFASREDIDTAMQLGCGHPMGPLSLCDFIGLDIMDAVCNSLYDEFKRPEYAAPPLLKRMVASGHLGRKTGRGFYGYEAAAAALKAAA